MQGLQLPLFPMGEDSDEFLLFLPGVDTDEIEDLGYEVDDEEDLLQVYCIYDEDDEGEPVGDTYPIEVNEFNRPQIEEMEQLVVLGPDDVEPEDLTDDPEGLEQLEDLFETLREMEEHQEDAPTPETPLDNE